MGQQSHYLDILLREPTIGHDLHARLLAAAHFRIANGDTLAVSWPDWRNTPGEFGLLFRVFGTEKALDSYKEAIGQLISAQLVRLFGISPVPDATGKVCFERERNTEKKFSPSRALRRQTRALARGEEVPLQKQTNAPRPNHYLWMQSKTTQKNFALSIVRKPSGSAEGGRNYGLGFELPDF